MRCAKLKLQNIMLQYITSQYIALHGIVLHLITPHHITSHHITLHYVTLCYIQMLITLIADCLNCNESIFMKSNNYSPNFFLLKLQKINTHKMHCTPSIKSFYSVPGNIHASPTESLLNIQGGGGRGVAKGLWSQFPLDCSIGLLLLLK